MYLNKIKSEILDVILQSKLLQSNQIEVSLFLSLNTQYTIVINKIKKIKAHENRYFVTGFICMDIESTQNNIFPFLGKMFSKWTSKNRISSVSFSDKVKVVDNNYLSCDFKGSLSIEDYKDNNLNNFFIQKDKSFFKNEELVGIEK